MTGSAPRCGKTATASLHCSGPQTVYGSVAPSRAACRSPFRALGASSARVVCTAYGSSPPPVM
eukprot:2949207-Lingulodinium_polyedra.AAC.1